MRTIKFRAWDGERMIYRNLHDRNWYSEDLGGGLIKGTHPDDKQLLITMQFTGLTDKNGKEIYEGDILAFEKEFNFKKVLQNQFEVKWEEYANGMVGFTQFTPKDMFVVVGNIHENPELL